MRMTTEGEIVSWEKNRIIVKVPKNVKSGKMYVQSGGKNSNVVNFNIESLSDKKQKEGR